MFWNISVWLEVMEFTDALWLNTNISLLWFCGSVGLKTFTERFFGESLEEAKNIFYVSFIFKSVCNCTTVGKTKITEVKKNWKSCLISLRSFRRRFLKTQNLFSICCCTQVIIMCWSLSCLERCDCVFIHTESLSIWRTSRSGFKKTEMKNLTLPDSWILLCLLWIYEVWFCLMISWETHFVFVYSGIISPASVTEH